MMNSSQYTAAPRYYAIGGMTIAVSADLPITDDTFTEKFNVFRISQPGDDVVNLHHHFALPDAASIPVGQRLFANPPWVIERTADGFTYRCVLPDGETLVHLGLFSADYRRGDLYKPTDMQYRQGQMNSLTFFPTDQLLLSALLAERQGGIIHSGGMIIDGHGLLFIGHSEAGKSTTVTMLRECGSILCDDRNIVRRHADGFHVYGTWSHGDIAEVSSAGAPLRALLFLEQSPTNALIPLTDTKEIMRRLLLTLIKPFVTADWWDKSFAMLETLAREVPAYRLQLDKSGEVRQTIAHLLHG